MPEPREISTDAAAADISERLAAIYAKIQSERMDGVPILNPRLSVEVLGVRAWNGHWLALVITPWFINLMLLPATPEQVTAWAKLALGSNVPHRFPAGRFDFIVGEEEGLGRYQMCSLFSPVLEFQDQAAARVAGRAALDALFDASLDEDKAKEAASADAAGEPQTAPTAAASGVSRRGLLTGKIASERGPAS